MIFKILFIALFSLFVTACSQQPTLSNTVQTLPSWYLNPTPNSTVFLYGVGEGKTLQEAKNHALNDVSSKHYDRYEYLPEKRRALEAWEQKLNETESGNVLMFGGGYER